MLFARLKTYDNSKVLNNWNWNIVHGISTNDICLLVDNEFKWFDKRQFDFKEEI